MPASGAPTSFVVGTYLPREGRSLGKLTIRPGEIALDTWPVARRLTTQNDGAITAVPALLMPPPWRESLIVAEGRQWWGIVPFPARSKPIRRAVEAAGFEVRDETVRFLKFGSRRGRDEFR